MYRSANSGRPIDIDHKAWRGDAMHCNAMHVCSTLSLTTSIVPLPLVMSLSRTRKGLRRVIFCVTNANPLQTSGHWAPPISISVHRIILPVFTVNPLDFRVCSYRVSAHLTAMRRVDRPISDNGFISRYLIRMAGAVWAYGIPQVKHFFARLLIEFQDYRTLGDSHFSLTLFPKST